MILSHVRRARSLATPSPQALCALNTQQLRAPLRAASRLAGHARGHAAPCPACVQWARPVQWACVCSRVAYNKSSQVVQWARPVHTHGHRYVVGTRSTAVRSDARSSGRRRSTAPSPLADAHMSPYEGAALLAQAIPCSRCCRCAFGVQPRRPASCGGAAA
jgi:hypothetical protein